MGHQRVTDRSLFTVSVAPARSPAPAALRQCAWGGRAGERAGAESTEGENALNEHQPVLSIGKVAQRAQVHGSGQQIRPIDAEGIGDA